MRLIKALVTALIGGAVLAVVLVLLMPRESIVRLAAQQFETETGRSLTVEGRVRTSFFPVIGASAQDVRISNPDWAGPGALLSAEEVEFGVDLAALIRGDIQIERVVLQSPVLHLQRDAEGRVNWDFGTQASGSGSDAAEPAPQRRLSLAEARISNGSLRYEDARTGTDLRFEAVEASLLLPQLDGPAEVEGSARLDGQPVTLSLRTDHASRMLAGHVTGVALDLAAAGAEITFAGRAGLDGPVAEGALQAHVPQPDLLMAMLGQPGAAVAPGFLPLGMTAQVTRTADGRLFARDGQFRAGGLRLRGNADLDPNGERPRLTGQFAGDVLDLRASGGNGTGGGAAASPGWSRARINADALGLVDADISLQLAGLRTDLTTLGRTDLRLAIDRARAVTTLREVALFGGTLSGEFVMNNRSGLSVGGDLRARDVDLLPLLSDLADYRRLGGTGSADLQFLGVGNTMHDIMNSLRGEGRLRLVEGEIIGLDLAGMLRNLDLSHMGEGSRTVYQSVTGSFTISDGVLRNDDLRLEAQRATVTGRGSVGLGQRNLDYRILPVALRDAETEVLRVPLMITGPWEAPRFRLDLEALAEERLRAERARLEELAREEAERLEQRAQGEAERRIERALGVEREEGESVQDTLRRGLEQEMGNRLRGLLGGD